jgi:hypothetical protein
MCDKNRSPGYRGGQRERSKDQTTTETKAWWPAQPPQFVLGTASGKNRSPGYRGGRRKQKKSRTNPASVRLQEQNEYEVEHAKFSQAAKEAEERAMQSTITGKAWTVASQVLSVVEEVKKKYEKSNNNENDNTSYIKAIATDDLFFQAKNLLRLQEEFQQAGKPTTVDLGFHYTKRENLSRIRTNGLLTKADREARKIESNFNGSTFGDGVYTADDHSQGGGGRYGDVGILVARLKGEQGLNCTLVDQRKVVVLVQSAQCLALVQFPRSMKGYAMLVDIQDALMKMVVGQYMNQIVVPVSTT